MNTTRFRRIKMQQIKISHKTSRRDTSDRHKSSLDLDLLHFDTTKTSRIHSVSKSTDRLCRLPTNQDQDSIYADPMYRDETSYDFTLDPASPAWPVVK